MSRKRAFHLILAVVVAVLVLRPVPTYSSNGFVIISTLAIDPVTPTTLYAGTNGGGVFKSTDGGGNWSATGLTNIHVWALVIDPLNPTTLYAGTDSGGVFKSLDGGVSWNATGLTGAHVFSLAINPLTSTTLYAGTDNGVVLKSTDGGASWNSVFLNPDFGSCPCGGVRALAIDPMTPTALFAGTDYTMVVLDDGTVLFPPGDVFKSTDGGTGWNASNLYGGIWGFSAIAIDPLTPTTVYAADYGSGSLSKSTDGGATWQLDALPAANVGGWVVGIGVSSLAIDPLTPATLYAGGPNGVLKSTDGGANWNAIDLFGVWGVFALAIDPRTTTTLYAGTRPNGPMGTSSVYKSTNSGANWNPTGLITWPYASSLSLNPTSVVGGSSSTGTVVLSAAAPAGGAAVTLGIDTNVISIPRSVTVAAGATSVNFALSTSSLTASIVGTISATYGGATSSAELTVTPTASLSSFSLNPISVVGGSPSTGTVALNAAAPVSGTTIPLSSSNPAVATVPASVTVPAGAMSASFGVSTSSVTAFTSVTISAASYSAALTVTPATTLSSLSLNPSSVVGGNTSAGAVTLSGSAPVGGVTVALSSSNSALATVPASVTVSAGAASANFTVSTIACASGAVTILGTYGAITRSAGLTMSPGPIDTIAIQQADYFASRRELRVAAKDTNSTATLRVYVTSTGELIGQLTKGGDGTYRGQFAWPVNPQNITIQSSLCAHVTRDAASK